MTKVNKDVVKTLIAARERIYKYGWTKYRMGNTKDGYCILGACMPNPKENESPFENPAADLLALMTDTHTSYVRASKFNDASTTTREDIDLLLDAAIGIEQAGGI